MNALRILVVLAAGWAVVALAGQVLLARGGGRRDYAQRAGRPLLGLLYNFTVAMSPGHKESVRRHPIEFGAGVLLHLGVAASLVEAAWLVAAPQSAGAWQVWLRAPLIAGLAAGVALLARRATSKMMRALSTPDDYLAALATCGLVGLALFPTWTEGRVLLAYTALLLIYLPLGKLRHAVFFFVARGNYGWRLGYRAVYPPAPAAGQR
jgi:hypothetical protein